MEVDGHQHFYSIYDPFWEDGNLRRQASYAAEVNLESLLFDRPLSDDTSGDASASHDSSAQNISSHLQCIHCKRKLVNAKWMRLHLLEGHDPTFLLKAKESNAYECLADGCSRKFHSEYGRKRHLLDFHKFPMTFDFYPGAISAKSRKYSIPRPRQEQMEVESQSKIRQVPDQVSFQRNQQKAERKFRKDLPRAHPQPNGKDTMVH